MIIETVKIVHKQSKTGYAIINKSDQKDGDVIYKEKKQKADKTK